MAHVVALVVARNNLTHNPLHAQLSSALTLVLKGQRPSSYPNALK